MKPEAWLSRPLNLLRFRLGRLLLRGTLYRLLVMSGLVGLVAVAGGLVAMWLGAGFTDPAEAIWWSFLRLSDPGYLGDDQGLARRVVSTVLTVLGYVIFLGAFVAIMTQWLNVSVRRLETGLTPVAARGHVLVAGWTDRTVSILREMFRTEERARSLLGYERGRLTAVLLAEDASPELHATLRERMGTYWRERQMILRQGEPLHLDHLERADFAHAAAILLPGDPYLSEGATHSDIRTIKAIASIGRQLAKVTGGRRPLLVAELFDARRGAVARSLYGGALEVVESDRLVARMFAQSVRYEGLSQAYRELLFSRQGARLRVLDLPHALEGATFRLASLRLTEVALLGVASANGVELLPDPSRVLSVGDRLIVFSGRDRLRVAHSTADLVEVLPVLPAAPSSSGRLLVLGWTRRVPALLAELARSGSFQDGAHVLSLVPVADREQEQQALAYDVPSVVHEQGDYTIPQVLRDVALERFDAVVLAGTDRLESGAESDARTLAGFAALRLCRPEARLLLELMDAENEPLLEGTRAEHLVTPMIIGRMLAQVALQRELRGVCDELFGPEGVEVVSVSAESYPGEGSLRERVLQAGQVPLGEVQAGEWGLSALPETPQAGQRIVCVARTAAP